MVHGLYILTQQPQQPQQATQLGRRGMIAHLLQQPQTRSPRHAILTIIAFGSLTQFRNMELFFCPHVYPLEFKQLEVFCLALLLLEQQLIALLCVTGEGCHFAPDSGLLIF